MLAVSKPLHQEEQNIFLAKYEQLKKSAIEISIIFDGDTSEIMSEFVATYAELLMTMYQQQIDICHLQKHKNPDGSPMNLDDYESKCKEMAESLGLFNLRYKLERLDDKISQKRLLN